MAEFIIGPREIKKAIKAGSVVSVMAAKNCPVKLIEDIKKEGIGVKPFDGDQKELGTRIGKPFPVALVGETIQANPVSRRVSEIYKEDKQ
ncbi:MAG: hypothetical protein HZB65_03960 [Candidatus Aenigmarchaeota archaeon]|nr:hypothetical protein [Candidatus Aenigmarchaeota archaeon]